MCRDRCRRIVWVPPGHATFDKEGQAAVSLGGRRSAALVQLPGAAGASEEEEEKIGSGLIGPRIIPRFIQQIGIAKRAELLKLKGEEGAEGYFPPGACKIMKTWAKSHRHSLLR